MKDDELKKINTILSDLGFISYIDRELNTLFFTGRISLSSKEIVSKKEGRQVVGLIMKKLFLLKDKMNKSIEDKIDIVEKIYAEADLTLP